MAPTSPRRTATRRATPLTLSRSPPRGERGHSVIANRLNGALPLPASGRGQERGSPATNYRFGRLIEPFSYVTIRLALRYTDVPPEYVRREPHACRTPAKRRAAYSLDRRHPDRRARSRDSRVRVGAD